MTNTYSHRWRSTFLATVPTEQTRAEIDFLLRHLPLDEYPRLLDLACGDGRHSVPLSEAGYAVTGIDVDPEMLGLAAPRASGPKPELVEADMRTLGSLPGTYDAVICMWQSFGHFDAERNRGVLGAVHRRLRPGGRLVLDVYNRRFFETRLGTRRREVDGVVVHEHKELRGRRLSVSLTYEGTDEADRFEWEVYAPEEIVAVAAAEGFAHLLGCRDFDESKGVSDDGPRMQMIFERI